jgi:hypothetical protein
VLKTAILNVADTGPLESLVKMLSAVGYKCVLPNERLKAALRFAGLDTVLDIDSLVRGMGYEYPMSLPEVGVESMSSADLFVDVKAHRNLPRIVARWPGLKGKILWYRINGGQPEHVVNDRGDHGDEINPGCPVLTPNQWYQNAASAYTCWPPFVRFDDYLRGPEPWWGCGICLIHNIDGWGYQRLVENVRRLGVYCFGRGSPDGLIPHQRVPGELANALAYVHLKSSDAPGYALYEALAAACPVICTRRLIWRCRMQELLIPGETCLVFDRETHDGLTDEDVRNCTDEVSRHLSALRDPVYNRQIGQAGRERLKSIMWGKEEDVASLRKFLTTVFPSS